MANTNKNLTPDQLKAMALRMLSRRALSCKELQQRLKQKGADQNTASEIVQYCLDTGYIDEKGIVEDHIRRGREIKLVGRFLLEYELRERGLGKELIAKGMDELYPDSDEPEIANRFALNKLRTMGDLHREKRVRRLGGALQRRGFRGDVVAEIMREVGRSEDPTFLKGE